MPDENQIAAVLVRLKIRVFPNTRQDVAITNEVRAKKSLGRGAGKWVKHLFPEEALKGIKEAGGEARRRHYDLTLPWEDGCRLLPTKAHPTHREDMAVLQNNFEARVNLFGREYAKWVALAEVMHGKTFDASLYPEWEIMRNNFSFEVAHEPVPAAAHFLTSDMATQAVEEMRQQLEASNRSRVEMAIRDVWNRVMTPVQALSEKLSNPEAVFRNSLIANVTEILDLVPQLNVTNNADLLQAANVIRERFANLDPELLRTDVNLRRDVAEAAKALVANFGVIGKRRFA